MSNPIRRMLSGLLFVWLILAVVDGSTLPIHTLMAMPSAPWPSSRRAILSTCDPLNVRSSGDTTWNAATVYLADNCAVTIPAGVTLTVQPGTTVKFLGGNAVQIVQGTLDA